MIAGACVAVRVPVDASQSVSGIMWYNNDGSLEFPEVLVAAGYDNVAPSLADAIVLVEDVQGVELDWSILDFGQDVMSPTGAFYVIFRLAEFTADQDRGVGPGVGFEDAETESCVYISAEGEEWIRLVTDKRLLVDPVYGSAGAKSAGSPRKTLMLPEPGKAAEQDREVLPAKTELLEPYPNPFNPTVTIAYTLKVAAPVAIDVYDIRGRRVREIRPGVQPAGVYRETWRGRDDRGRQQASGVYFIRLRAGEVEQTRRVLLLK